MVSTSLQEKIKTFKSWQTKENAIGQQYKVNWTRMTKISNIFMFFFNLHYIIYKIELREDENSDQVHFTSQSDKSNNYITTGKKNVVGSTAQK